MAAESSEPRFMKEEEEEGEEEESSEEEDDELSPEEQGQLGYSFPSSFYLFTSKPTCALIYRVPV